MMRQEASSPENRVRLNLEFYGVIGPEFGIPASVGLDWELCRTPEWKAPFEIQFSAELRVPEWLTKNVINPDNLKISPVSLYQADLLTGQRLCEITPAALPVATRDAAYDVTLELQVAGIALPQSDLTWSLDSGTLPAGISLTGERITGTPTEVGLFPITVKAVSTSTGLTKTK